MKAAWLKHWCLFTLLILFSVDFLFNYFTFAKGWIPPIVSIPVAIVLGITNWATIHGMIFYPTPIHELP